MKNIGNCAIGTAMIFAAASIIGLGIQSDKQQRNSIRKDLTALLDSNNIIGGIPDSVTKRQISSDSVRIEGIVKKAYFEGQQSVRDGIKNVVKRFK